MPEASASEIVHTRGRIGDEANQERLLQTDDDAMSHEPSLGSPVSPAPSVYRSVPWTSAPTSSAGSNDLTQLGVDCDSEVCAPLFDERDGAVLDAIRQMIEQAKPPSPAHGLHLRPCGVGLP